MAFDTSAAITVSGENLRAVGEYYRTLTRTANEQGDVGNYAGARRLNLEAGDVAMVARALVGAEVWHALLGELVEREVTRKTGELIGRMVATD